MGEYLQHVQPLNLIKGTLIDLETTGIPSDGTSHEIVTVGFLISNSLTVIQRTSRPKQPFYKSVMHLVGRLPRPFFAYNCSFDRRILEIELGMRFREEDFLDLMAPWKSKCMEDGRKWPSLDELISEPEAYYGEERVKGSQIPSLWNSYIEGHSSTEVLKLIADHCHSDLLRELMLLLRYPTNHAPPVSLLRNNRNWVEV